MIIEGIVSTRRPDRRRTSEEVLDEESELSPRCRRTPTIESAISVPEEAAVILCVVLLVHPFRLEESLGTCEAEVPGFRSPAYESQGNPLEEA